jgi:hypothetical protein
MVGGVAGLLVGIGATFIPGIGAVLAAGPLASLIGAGVGAASGAVLAPIMDALMDAGVPEEDAEIFAEGLRRGGTILSVDVDDDLADEVEDVMERSGASNIDERAQEWRDEGWHRSSAEQNARIDEDFDFDDNDTDDLREAIEKDDRIEDRARGPMASPVRRYGRMV